MPKSGFYPDFVWGSIHFGVSEFMSYQAYLSISGQGLRLSTCCCYVRFGIYLPKISPYRWKMIPSWAWFTDLYRCPHNGEVNHTYLELREGSPQVAINSERLSSQGVYPYRFERFQPPFVPLVWILPFSVYILFLEVHLQLRWCAHQVQNVGPWKMPPQPIGSYGGYIYTWMGESTPWIDPDG